MLDRRDRQPLERWPDADGELERVDSKTLDEAEHSELCQTVAWALAQLPPKQRAAVVRRVYESVPDRLTALEPGDQAFVRPSNRFVGSGPNPVR